MNSLLAFLPLLLLTVKIVFGDVQRSNFGIRGGHSGSYPHVWTVGGRHRNGGGAMGLSGSKGIDPVYTTGYSSPLITGSGSDSPDEGGVVVAKNFTNGLSDGEIGIRISPGKGVLRARDKFMSLHHKIHHLKEEALKAKSESSAAELKASMLLALNQSLQASLKSNEAEMLEEEEQRLLAQSASNPKVVVKDTLPVVDIANGVLDFKHHNELLRKRLAMVGNDQKNAIKQAINDAKLHVARTRIVPDSLEATNPQQYNEFIANGPAKDLTFEIPVDPSVGQFHISGQPNEDLRASSGPITTGDLPYFVAHRDGAQISDPLHHHFPYSGRLRASG